MPVHADAEKAHLVEDPTSSESKDCVLYSLVVQTHSFAKDELNIYKTGESLYATFKGQSILFAGQPKVSRRKLVFHHSLFDRYVALRVFAKIADLHCS